MITDKIQRRLNDSAAARWSALIIVSFTMMMGYFLTDVMAPLEDLLESSISDGGLGWSSTEYGIFTSAYSWINVGLLMLFVSGLILDKMGVRFTGLLSSALMVVGAFIKWYAISDLFTFQGECFGMNVQVLVASVGYAIFGVGSETAGITVTKVIVRWFTGYEMALAMGIQVALARIGTAAALMCSLPLANKMGHISAPVLLGAIALCIGLLSYMVYCVMDKKLDASLAGKSDGETPAADEGFKFRDVAQIVCNKGFWLITILCLLFYSGVFPFLKYATKLMIYKYDVDPNFAGIIPGLLPFGTILLTPIFGGIYDRIGKGVTLMLIGSLLLMVVHLLFALPWLNVWWFAVVNMILLGISFSLVPSAMWPAVPKILPMKLLGTAYALIFLIQNIGLGGVPAIIGFVIDRYCKGEGDRVDFTLPMLIFAACGVLAVLVTWLLKREDKKKGYGLEEANIEA